MAPILFLHIPRTAGMSLKRMCVEALGANRCLTDVHFLRVEREHGVDLDAYEFVEGHVVAGFFGATTAAEHWPSRGFTILRDPVARVVSQAVHARHRPDQVRGDEWREALRAEVTDPHALFERVPALCDLQTRQLGFPPFRWPHRIADESALEAAVALLERLPFGLTEAFPVSAALFADRFGLRLPGVVRSNATVADRDADIRSAEFAAAAREHNGFDLRLYEQAAALFAERAREHAEELLALPADEAVLEVAIGGPAGSDIDAVNVATGVSEVSLRGTALLGGRPAEAVLIRVGEELTPVGGCYASARLAERTGNPDHRYAGFEGALAIPAGITEIEVIAVDRSRRRRGSVEVAVVRI